MKIRLWRAVFEAVLSAGSPHEHNQVLYAGRRVAFACERSMCLCNVQPRRNLLRFMARSEGESETGRIEALRFELRR